MSAYVVWLDSTNAKVFHISGSKVDVKVTSRHDHDHHTHNKNDDKHKDSSKFFLNVAEQLNAKGDGVLLVGPGVAKNHFVTFLESHHKRELAQRIVGTESMDNHQTDAQIVAFARQYFPENVL